jgi:ferrochelatase
MSFHGLPENSKKLGDPYFDQCHRSAKLIAKNLELPEQGWQLVFQSRFGRAEWLKPYCVEVLQKLPGQGIKNIDVVCPGFSIDCLETLEEIAITNKKVFIDAGGKGYRYIPALNATQIHAQSLLEIISKT